MFLPGNFKKRKVARILRGNNGENMPIMKSVSIQNAVVRSSFNKIR